jgi:hypothetical protein
MTKMHITNKVFFFIWEWKTSNWFLKSFFLICVFLNILKLMIHHANNSYLILIFSKQNYLIAF